MTRSSRLGNHKFFNMTKQSDHSFIKASNVLLKPFGAVPRNTQDKTVHTIRMPHNPLGVTIKHKQMVTLTDFCTQRNIPFNENE